MANGVVLWEGLSELDGSPIVLIATGISKRIPRFKDRLDNPKTGDLVQTWIIRQDVSPVDAANTGADAAVCGDCRHRGKSNGTRAIGRSCYVNLGTGVMNIWKAYRNGAYPARARWDFGHMRIGSYGDPGAVPAAVWADIVANNKIVSGYTHQWRHRDDLKSFCMASVDSLAEKIEANLLGWRTFRVGNAVHRGEISCPASAEMGKKTMCADCRACGGLGAKAKTDIAIVPHGQHAINFYRVENAT